MEIFARSHQGMVRSNNEDSFYFRATHPILLVVADGMGGHQAGEVASKTAVNAVKNCILTDVAAEEDPQHVLAQAVRSANTEVFTKATADQSLQGMGTTLTVALEHEATWYFAHVGDSRAYVLRNASIEQISSDHTLVAELVRTGAITDVEAEEHPQKNVITRAVGTDLSVKPDLFNIPMKGADALVLCTDGLTNVVNDKEIHQAIQSDSPLNEAVEQLVQLANERGGQDNITILAIRHDRSDEGVN